MTRRTPFRKRNIGAPYIGVELRIGVEIRRFSGGVKTVSLCMEMG